MSSAIKTQISPEIRDALEGHEWQIGLCGAPCEAPCSFCYGFFCPCCAAYGQRNDILDITGESYHWFNGMCVCCSACGATGPQDDMKVCCLCCEVCCCTGIAASINRYLIQTRFAKENSECDDTLMCCTSCIMCTASLCQCLACIAQCFGLPGADQVDDIADCLSFVANCLYMTMLGCWYAQQHEELEHIREVGYNGVLPEVYHLLPPAQQEMLAHE